MPDAPLPPPRREPRDIGLRFALASAGVVIAALLAVGGLTAWLFPDSLRSPPLRLPVPPQPALQSSPRDDMGRLRADQLTRLTGTGWIDRDRNLVHIPIDLAMRKLAERGIPEWPAP